MTFFPGATISSKVPAVRTVTGPSFLAGGSSDLMLRSSLPAYRITPMIRAQRNVKKAHSHLLHCLAVLQPIPMPAARLSTLLLCY